jgi:hypothetical protein
MTRTKRLIVRNFMCGLSMLACARKFRVHLSTVDAALREALDGSRKRGRR